MDEAVKTIAGSNAMQVRVENNRRMLAMFSKRTQGDILKGSFAVACEMWQAVFLPKRFTDYLERPPWNYKLEGRWVKVKAAMAVHFPDAMNPLVYEGVLRDMAQTGRVKVSAAKGIVRGTITIPAHRLRPHYQQMLRKVSRAELDAVAKLFARQLEKSLESAAFGLASANQAKITARKARAAQRRANRATQRKAT